MKEMIKVIMGGSFDGMDKFAEIVKVSSRGLDTGWLTKRASISDRIKDLRPEKGYTYVHLLALGDGETYGCNRNGDWFGKRANERKHKTFETHAQFYRHHKNKPDRGDPAYGSVKIAEYNPVMHRVELVVALDDNKAAEELDLLEKKGEFPVSMACKVPYDRCSICNHIATHQKPLFDGDKDAYCEHASKYLTKIAADGRQVYVDNEDPTFFDISRVHRPADRIAYTFQKVANASVVQSGIDLAVELGYYSLAQLSSGSSAETIKKASLVQRLADLEQSGEWDTQPIKQAAVLYSEVPDLVLEKLSTYANTPDKFRDVLSALADRRMMLSPTGFYKLATGAQYVKYKDELPSISACLPNVFSNIKDANEFCKDATYDCGTGLLPKNLRDELDRVKSDVALTIEASQTRFIKCAAHMPKVIVKKAVQATPAARALAQEYAKYQVGFLTKLADAFDRQLLEYLTIASNHVR